jgi:hypothetical protein
VVAGSLPGFPVLVTVPYGLRAASRLDASFIDSS